MSRFDKQLDAYHDGALSERQRSKLSRQIDDDPELAARLRERSALGNLVREAWNEGPPAPSPEMLIGMLRPEMRRVDAELAADSAWTRFKDRFGDWIQPAPVAALVGTGALVALALLPGTQNGDLLKADFGDAARTAQAQPAAELAPNPNLLTVASDFAAEAPMNEPRTPIYDLEPGENPLMVFEAEDATVIWVIPDDDLCASFGQRRLGVSVMRTTFLTSVLATAFLLAVPSPDGASAQQVEKAASIVPPVSFNVSVVYARKEEGKVDTRVLHLVNRLPMKFGTVELVEQKAMSVRFGEEAKLPLSTGGEVRLLPVLVHQNQLHMHFQMPNVVDTRLKMTNGRPVILGGVPHRDGYLIIEVKPDFKAYLTPDETPKPAGPQTFSVGHPSQAPAKD